MRGSGAWLWKSFLISAGVALLTFAGSSLFFKIHQELDIQPARAWQLGLGTFLVSAIITMIYFRMRSER
jgi:uncharacterized membrane protein (DUF485 family)